MRLLYIKGPQCESDLRIVRQLIRLTTDRKVTAVKSPAGALNALRKASAERPFDALVTSPVFDEDVVAELVHGILKNGTRVTLVPVVTGPDQSQRAYGAGADGVLLFANGTLVNPEETFLSLARRFRRSAQSLSAAEPAAAAKPSPASAGVLGELLNLRKYLPETRTPQPILVDVVRHVDADLADAVARLVQQLAPAARVPGPWELDQIIKDPGTILIVAREGRAVVGMLTLHSFRSTTGIQALIQDLVVEETAKGRGVSEMLTQEAIRLSALRGANSAQLTSRPSSNGTGRLYERLGFERREAHLYRYRVSG